MSDGAPNVEIILCRIPEDPESRSAVDQLVKAVRQWVRENPRLATRVIRRNRVEKKKRYGR